MERRAESFEAKMKRAGYQLNKKISDANKVSFIYADISAVNKDNNTIDAVSDDGYTLSGILLDLIPNGGNSILFYPAVGSRCIIGFVEDKPDLSFLIQMTALDEVVIWMNREEENDSVSITDAGISIKRGGTTCVIKDGEVTLDSDKIVFNGGDNGGLVLIKELTDKLNNLQSELQSFITSTYNTHTHPYSDTTPTGSITSVTSATTSKGRSPSRFNASDYENKDIMQ